MKRGYIFTFIFFICIGLYAQNIESKDKDIKINIDELNIPDGYLLDMKSILPAPPTLALPVMDLDSYYRDKMSESFIYKSKVLYGQGNFFNTMGSSYYYGIGNSVTLNSATYKFKNGIRLTTYGQYDANGYKRHDPSALPWQKNNFNGAFEMKTRNGNFGVRVEVHAGRETPY